MENKKLLFYVFFWGASGVVMLHATTRAALGDGSMGVSDSASGDFGGANNQNVDAGANNTFGDPGNQSEPAGSSVGDIATRQPGGDNASAHTNSNQESKGGNDQGVGTESVGNSWFDLGAKSDFSADDGGGDAKATSTFGDLVFVGKSHGDVESKDGMKSGSLGLAGNESGSDSQGAMAPEGQRAGTDQPLHQQASWKSFFAQDVARQEAQVPAGHQNPGAYVGQEPFVPAVQSSAMSSPTEPGQFIAQTSSDYTVSEYVVSDGRNGHVKGASPGKNPAAQAGGDQNLHGQKERKAHSPDRLYGQFNMALQAENIRRLSLGQDEDDVDGFFERIPRTKSQDAQSLSASDHGLQEDKNLMNDSLNSSLLQKAANQPADSRNEEDFVGFLKNCGWYPEGQDGQTQTEPPQKQDKSIQQSPGSKAQATVQTDPIATEASKIAITSGTQTEAAEPSWAAVQTEPPQKQDKSIQQSPGSKAQATVQTDPIATEASKIAITSGTQTEAAEPSWAAVQTEPPQKQDKSIQQSPGTKAQAASQTNPIATEASKIAITSGTQTEAAEPSWAAVQTEPPQKQDKSIQQSPGSKAQAAVQTDPIATEASKIGVTSGNQTVKSQRINQQPKKSFSGSLDFAPVSGSLESAPASPENQSQRPQRAEGHASLVSFVKDFVNPTAEQPKSQSLVENANEKRANVPLANSASESSNLVGDGLAKAARALPGQRVGQKEEGLVPSQAIGDQAGGVINAGGSGPIRSGVNRGAASSFAGSGTAGSEMPKGRGSQGDVGRAPSWVNGSTRVRGYMNGSTRAQLTSASSARVPSTRAQARIKTKPVQQPAQPAVPNQSKK
jgi:hypothetical protein